MAVTLEDGKILVKSARFHVEDKLGKGEFPQDIFGELKRRFQEKQGVFTTIETYPEHHLRGCIGYPYPVYPLWKALISSAEEAAFGDPRFPPLEAEELDGVVFEVTVLTPPEPVRVKHSYELPQAIKVGRDGLIVKASWTSGLLLPQVAVEYGWDEEEFLSQTCVKAGLPVDAWKMGDVEVMKFTGQIFAEKTPSGEVEEKPLSKSCAE